MRRAASSLQAARERIRTAYDPELLRQSGHRLIDLLSNHLSKVEHSEIDVLPWREPECNVRDAETVLQAMRDSGCDQRGLADRFSEIIQTMLDHGLNLHHPHYIGHQVPAPFTDCRTLRFGRRGNQSGDGGLRDGPLGDRH